MIATEEIVRKKFTEYNIHYFNGELTQPNKVEISNSVKMLGYFSCDRVIGKRKPKNTKIEISGCYDFTDEQFRDILVHEMIHFYLVYKHIDNTSSHGTAFQEIANRLNKDYGMNITIRINTYYHKKSPKTSPIKWFFGHWFGI